MKEVAISPNLLPLSLEHYSEECYEYLREHYDTILRINNENVEKVVIKMSDGVLSEYWVFVNSLSSRNNSYWISISQVVRKYLGIMEIVYSNEKEATSQVSKISFSPEIIFHNDRERLYETYYLCIICEQVPFFLAGNKDTINSNEIYINSHKLAVIKKPNDWFFILDPISYWPANIEYFDKWKFVIFLYYKKYLEKQENRKWVKVEDIEFQFHNQFKKDLIGVSDDSEKKDLWESISLFLNISQQERVSRLNDKEIGGKDKEGQKIRTKYGGNCREFRIRGAKLDRRVFYVRENEKTIFCEYTTNTPLH